MRHIVAVESIAYYPNPNITIDTSFAPILPQHHQYAIKESQKRKKMAIHGNLHGLRVLAAALAAATMTMAPIFYCEGRELAADPSSSLSDPFLRRVLGESGGGRQRQQLRQQDRREVKSGKDSKSGKSSKSGRWGECVFFWRERA